MKEILIFNKQYSDIRNACSKQKKNQTVANMNHGCINYIKDFLYVTSFTSNTVTKISKRTGEINLIVVVDDGIPVGAEIWDPTNTSPVSSTLQLGFKFKPQYFLSPLI